MVDGRKRCVYENVLSNVRTAELTLTTPTMIRDQVQNIGNVDLSAVGVVFAGVTHDCVDRDLLRAGDTFTCTGNYSLSWTDIASGLLSTVAM